MKYPYRYLITLEYLGLGLHGWSKQPKLKTVHSQIDRTIKFILGHNDFRTICASRTDSKVSSLNSLMELFLFKPIDPSTMLLKVNQNLPSDIRAIAFVEQKDPSFNILKSPKSKTYHYVFGHQEKAHPFSAGILKTYMETLAIDQMILAAQCFEGTHDFINYVVKPTEKTMTTRTIIKSRIIKNNIYKASFFPKQTFIYEVESEGFMRGQVRMMMGQLFLVGLGEQVITGIVKSLKSKLSTPFGFIAPPNGLILFETKVGSYI